MLIRLYQSSFKLLAEICAWLALAMPTFLFLGSILVFFFGDGDFKTRFLGVLYSLLMLVMVFLLEVLLIAPIMVLFTLDTRLKSINAMLDGEPAYTEITHEKDYEIGELEVGPVAEGGKIVNRNTYAILSLFFGGLGIQYFYIGKFGKGLLCLVFCWTFIPFVVGFISGAIMFQKKTDRNGNILIK